MFTKQNKTFYKSGHNMLMSKMFSFNKLLIGTFNRKGKKLKSMYKITLIKYILKNKIYFDPNLVIFTAFNELAPNTILAMIHLGGSRHGVPLPII